MSVNNPIKYSSIMCIGIVSYSLLAAADPSIIDESLLCIVYVYEQLNKQDSIERNTLRAVGTATVGTSLAVPLFSLKKGKNIHF